MGTAIDLIERTYPGFIRAEFWASQEVFWLCSAVIEQGKKPCIVVAPLVTATQAKLLTKALRMACNWIDGKAS